MFSYPLAPSLWSPPDQFLSDEVVLRHAVNTGNVTSIVHTIVSALVHIVVISQQSVTPAFKRSPGF